MGSTQTRVSESCVVLIVLTCSPFFHTNKIVVLDHSAQILQSPFNAILFRPILPISRCRLLETATATGFFTAQGPIKNPWQPDGAGFVEQPLIGQHLPGKLYVWSRTSRLRSNRATGASAGQSAAIPCPSLAGRTTADVHAATSPELFIQWEIGVGVDR